MNASLPQAPAGAALNMSLLPIQVQFILQNLGAVDPAVNGWLREAVRNGSHPDDIAMALAQTGRPPEIAGFIAHLAHCGFYLSRGENALDERLIPRSTAGSPKVPHAQKHLLDLGDRQVRVALSLGQPDVVIYDDFLTDEECDFLKTVVDGKLKRSAVVGQNFTNTQSGARTSYGAFLHVGSHPLIRTIENRVARLTGVPVEHGEGLQVLRYERADEYQPHFDFFEPGTPDEARLLEQPGNRTGTMIFYLNDVEEGGATYFPKLDLAVHPRKRAALWFSYMGADGVLDQRTEHAGLPIIRGDKWIATKWLRQRPFPPMPKTSPDQIVLSDGG